MKSLTATQIKTGVMPGTADSAADDEALGKGSLIMRAMWRDGEDFLARAN
jgi:hypothetical protein